MRIIAGKLGGLNFDAPKGQRTHPMSEKMRGALFSVLGDIKDLTVLDAFAGSGALGLEAISRGAACVTAIDNDRRACEAIASNAKKLKVDNKLKATRANVSGWSDNNEGKEFDLVFVAPPYDNLQTKIVQKMVKHVDDKGLLVLDWPGDLEAPTIERLNITHQKNHGDAQLAFYKKILL